MRRRATIQDAAQGYAFMMLPVAFKDDRRYVILLLLSHATLKARA